MRARRPSQSPSTIDPLSDVTPAAVDRGLLVGRAPGRVRVERTLGQMARESAIATTVAEALRLQLGHVFALLRPKTCFVSQYSAERDQLTVISVRGRNDPRVCAVAPGEGPTGSAYAELSIGRARGLVAAPIETAAGPLGTLTIVGSSLRISDSLITALATTVGASWVMARLREDSALRTKDLETAVAGLRALERSRDELLANVSQDLKNPLTTLKSYLALMSRAALGELSDRQARAVVAMDRNADRLLRMINDLLLFSRLQTGKLQLDARPFGLKAVLGEALELIAPLGAQARIEARLMPSPEVFIRGDRSSVREAILLMLEHALHQSPSDARVDARLVNRGQFAEVSVVDSGPSIHGDPTVFDATPTTQPSPRRRGGALGLPVVAKIARLHGGRVELEALEPEGHNRLSLYLPVFVSALSPAKLESQARAGGILLVEDDTDCREVLAEVLANEGYQVTVAASATEAKSIVTTLRPVLVLLDLRLAEEDGMSVLRHIRSTPEIKDVSVFIVSGARDLAALSAGSGLSRVDGFFEKPLDLPRVLSIIAEVVQPADGLVSGPA